MKTYRKQQLLEKGWLDDEIRHAEKSLDQLNRNEVHFSRMVFWSALILVIFTNLALSLILVPYLIVLTNGLLYLIVVLLAGSIGFLYDLLINDVAHLEKKHHLIAGIILPLLAIANFLITVVIANNIISELEVHNPLHNAWLVGLVFAMAFILPYLGNRIKFMLKEKRIVYLAKEV